MRAHRTVVTGAVLATALAVSALTGCATRLADATDQFPPAATTVTATPISATPTSTTARVPAVADAASTQACATNTAAQLILVDISRQQAWVCAGHALVRSTPVTTGATVDGDDTPTGSWHVLRKEVDQTLTLLNGSTYFVHYWLPFEGNTYGFHDASWQVMPFGSQGYHSQGSHGCVHLPMSMMAWLYSWVHVGARVTIRA